MLGEGLMKAKTVTQLRLNFCIYKREILLHLMPALCDPSALPLRELDLAANGMTDDKYGPLLGKIVASHTEYRD